MVDSHDPSDLNVWARLNNHRSARSQNSRMSHADISSQLKLKILEVTIEKGLHLTIMAERPIGKG